MISCSENTTIKKIKKEQKYKTTNMIAESLVYHKQLYLRQQNKKSSLYHSLYTQQEQNKSISKEILYQNELKFPVENEYSNTKNQLNNEVNNLDSGLNDDYMINCFINFNYEEKQNFNFL